MATTEGYEEHNKSAHILFVADKNVTHEVHRLFQFSDADRRKIFSAFGYFIL